MFSSLQACQNGSQWGSCSDGYPSFVGFSENVTAWHPFFATRRTSSAISMGSQIGGSACGIIRPGYAPHHWSMCQSLYARNTANPRSLSCARAKYCPQNCGKDGKFIAAATPFAFMSRMRSWMS